MSFLRRLLATIALGVLILAGAVGATLVLQELMPTETPAANGIAAGDGAQGRPYPGDPNAEAALVTAEEERIDLVSTVGSSVAWQVDRFDGPYRVPTAPIPTLVLPERSDPYTLAELQEIAPESISEQADGSVLLSENLLALEGAALDVSSGAATTIRMLSAPGSFVSIVTMGGGFTAVGTGGSPVAFTSHDPATGAPDTETADGRAYVRVIGGTVNVQHARFTDLGFWSGETGGLSLTGVGPSDPQAAIGTAEAPDDGAPTITGEELSGLVAEVQTAPGPVTGSVSAVVVGGNAFGLFVSNATQLAMSGLDVSNSLVDGVVLHRNVTGSTVDASRSTGNAVDGIVVSRSSSGIAMTGVESSGNGRNGISVDGRPLADRPTANGTPLGEYGDVHVKESVLADNSRYGIQVSGGQTITIAGSEITGNVVGIALDAGASGVDVSDNILRAQSRQSISVRAGVDDTTIHDNRFASVDTGVRIAGASASVEDNAFSEVSNHAVTLVGDATGSRVTGNTVAGTGSTPIHDDAAGGYIAGNDTEQWKKEVTPTSVVNTVAQPLTLVWVGLAALLLFTAITGARKRHSRDPYSDHRPLTELTPGIVSVDQLRGRNS